MATTAVQAVEKNITSVALADIQPSNYNPRKNFDETSLAELAESIRQQGVLQPIGVRQRNILTKANSVFKVATGNPSLKILRVYFFFRRVKKGKPPSRASRQRN